VQAKLGRVLPRKCFRLPQLQSVEPKLYKPQNLLQIQVLMLARIAFQIALCEPQQRPSRAWSALLQVNKCPRQLDQSFVERAIGSMPVFQPQFLQDFVRFEIKLPIEAVKESEVVGIGNASLACGDQFGDFRRLLAHQIGSRAPAASHLAAFLTSLQPIRKPTVLFLPGPWSVVRPPSSVLRTKSLCSLPTPAPFDTLGRMVKPALGRGLSALLGGAPSAPKPAPAVSAPVAPTPVSLPPEGVRRVAIKQIKPCPFQPRKDFSDESLRELADSIKEQGVVQPLLVRQRGSDFELIAGERRWRAAQLVGLAEVPILIREADDRTVLELALIENLQRENLNPLEEALGFAQLVEQFHLTQEQAAARVGKSRAAVANSLRLLKLPQEVQERLRTGQLSVGHAKVILGLPGQADQRTLAERVATQVLNVRQTEELVAQWQQRSTPPVVAKPGGLPVGPIDAHVNDLENRLKQRLGTKVLLRYREGKGAIEIRYFSDAELERLLQILGVQAD
jgi:ParB family chromosome partitioning protein